MAHLSGYLGGRTQLLASIVLYNISKMYTQVADKRIHCRDVNMKIKIRLRSAHYSLEAIHTSPLENDGIDETKSEIGYDERDRRHVYQVHTYTPETKTHWSLSQKVG